MKLAGWKLQLFQLCGKVFLDIINKFDLLLLSVTLNFACSKVLFKIAGVRFCLVKTELHLSVTAVLNLQNDM